MNRFYDQDIIQLCIEKLATIYGSSVRLTDSRLVGGGCINHAPFLGFSGGKIAAITTGLVIAGEITFYLNIFMIGKEFLVKIKNKFRKLKPKPELNEEN